MARCSGVRNRMFESDTFGSTLVWRHEDWVVNDIWGTNSIDRLTLVDATNGSMGSGPFEVTNAIDIHFIEDADPWSQSRAVEDVFRTLVRERYPDHPIDGPNPGAAGWHAELTVGNNVVIWDIDTHPYPGSRVPDHEADRHIAVMFHERLQEYNHRRYLAERVFKSIERPKPYFKDCYENGVIEVIEAELFRNNNEFTLNISLANCDIFTATLDMHAFRLDGPFTLRSVTWNGVGHDADTYEIPSDTVGLTPHDGVLVFESDNFQHISCAEYAERGEMVFLAHVDGTTNPAAKPRINPGG